MGLRLRNTWMCLATSETHTTGLRILSFIEQFMQKKAAKEAQAKEDLEKSKADSAARWVIKGARADPADDQGQQGHQG